jgi:adenylylsulfate kinase-like enzyme
MFNSFFEVMPNYGSNHHGIYEMVKPQYPPRLWTLAGFPGSGKSTFAAQMRPPLLAIDADRRFSEVLNLRAR